MERKFFLKSFREKLIANILLIMLSLFIVISAFSYNIFLKSYGDLIVTGNYSEALNLQESHLKFNPFKAVLFNRDQDRLISLYLQELNLSYEDEKLSEKDFIGILKGLDILTDDAIVDVYKSNLKTEVEADLSYNKALSFLKDKAYPKALEALKKIPEYSSLYQKASTKKEEILGDYKADLLSLSKSYAEKDYYSKAITALEEYISYNSEDKSITDEIESLKNKRSEYLKNKEGSQAAASSSVISLLDIATEDKTSIESHINGLGLTSNTPYLAWVSTKNQMTYIFQGRDKAWQLTDKFKCSTGIKGYETPLGIFTMNGDKDTWFFNEKYNDGAKYWTRINGVYLFHSIPFDKSQSQVTDSILGEPRSHGCIRLSVENAKWIYDNLTKGTTVVVR